MDNQPSCLVSIIEDFIVERHNCGRTQVRWSWVGRGLEKTVMMQSTGPVGMHHDIMYLER